MGCANAKEEADPLQYQHRQGEGEGGGAADGAANDRSATPHHASPQDDSAFSPLLVAHAPAAQHHIHSGSLGAQSPRTFRTLGLATSLASPHGSTLNPLLVGSSAGRQDDGSDDDDDGLPPLTPSNLAAFLHADTERLLRLRTLGGPAIPGCPRCWEEVLEEWFDNMPVYPDPIPGDGEDDTEEEKEERRAPTTVFGPDDSPASHSPAMDALLPRAALRHTATASVAVFCSRTTRRAGQGKLASGSKAASGHPDDEDDDCLADVFGDEPSSTPHKSEVGGVAAILSPKPQQQHQKQRQQPLQGTDCPAVPSQQEAEFYGDAAATNLETSSLLPLTEENINTHVAQENARLKRLRAQGGPAIPGQPRSWFEVMDEWLAGSRAALADAAAGVNPPVHNVDSGSDAES